MEFMKEYKAKIEEYRGKYRQLQGEINQLDKEIDSLNVKYSVAIGEMDIDGANKHKRKIKDLEVEIETNRDIMDMLSDKMQVGDEELAKKAAKGYLAFRNKHSEKTPALIKKAEKKRQEYLEVLQELDEYNKVLEGAAKQLKAIEKAANWKDPQIIKEVGFILESEHGEREKIKLYDYFIKNLSDVRGWN